MEKNKITLEDIYHRLVLLERALRSKGILEDSKYKLDDEGELIDEVKAELEKRRKSSNYISHEEVKRRILSKK